MSNYRCIRLSGFTREPFADRRILLCCVSHFNCLQDPSDLGHTRAAKLRLAGGSATLSYSVTIYCPDTHLVYDAKTPDRVGVGGGVTARLRLAQALARRGHRVTVVGNVPRLHTYKGVTFQPFLQVKHIEADVLILNSTGGALDLRRALDLKLQCRLIGVRIGGVTPIKGLAEIPYDYLVAPSNFVRQEVLTEWGVQPDRLLVTHNGVQRRKPRLSTVQKRDLFRLVYTGHPSKGLESALAILRLLRSEDRRFQLHVYGGNRLWGGEDQEIEPEAGVSYHGLIGQQRLARELERSSVALSLQAIKEGFGLAIVEAMAAGAVVLASPVGAYPEIIRHGYDGFLIPGSHTDAQTQASATTLIMELVRNADLAEYVRRNAVCAPLSWDTIARAWEGHWALLLNQKEGHPGTNSETFGGCLECSGPQVALADGYHCTGCGRYNRALSPSS